MGMDSTSLASINFIDPTFSAKACFDKAYVIILCSLKIWLKLESNSGELNQYQMDMIIKCLQSKFLNP
jgi:hypothetical protein